MSLQLQLVETFLEELPSAAYCNQISLARLLMHFELILDKHPVASRNPGSRCLYNGLAQNLLMHSLLVADEVSRESLQLMTAIRDEGDGLTLCEWHFVSGSHKVMAAHAVILSSKCYCGGFLCNLIGVMLDDLL
jgi:hypothetical protein